MPQKTSSCSCAIALQKCSVNVAFSVFFIFLLILWALPALAQDTEKPGLPETLPLEEVVPEEVAPEESAASKQRPPASASNDSIENKAFFTPNNPAPSSQTNEADQSSSSFDDSSFDPLPSLGNLLLGLLIFVAIVGGIIWFFRRNPSMKRYFGGGPIKVISRAYIAPRFGLFLVKIGDRVLLLGQSPESIQNLLEIHNPTEVSKLLSEAAETNPESVSNNFREMLRSITSSKTQNKPQKKQEVQNQDLSSLVTKSRAQEGQVSPKKKDLQAGQSEEIGYESRMKLSAIREELEKAKARLK